MEYLLSSYIVPINIVVFDEYTHSILVTPLQYFNSRGMTYDHTSKCIQLFIDLLMKEYKTITSANVHQSTPNHVSQEQTTNKILMELSPRPKLSTQGHQSFVFHPEEERRSQIY